LRLQYSQGAHPQRVRRVQRGGSAAEQPVMGASQVKGQVTRQTVLRLKMEFEVQKHRLLQTKNKCVASLVTACPCCLKWQTKLSERNMKETFKEACQGLEPFMDLIGFDELDTWSLCVAAEEDVVVVVVVVASLIFVAEVAVDAAVAAAAAAADEC
jgi:hypothetical protein